MTFMPRITINYEEYDAAIHDYKHLGYQIHREDKNHAILLKNPWGTKFEHLVIFLIFGWWTLGLANLLCMVYSRGTAEKIVIRKPPFRREPIVTEDGINRKEFNPYIIDQAA